MTNFNVIFTISTVVKSLLPFAGPFLFQWFRFRTYHFNIENPVNIDYSLNDTTDINSLPAKANAVIVALTRNSELKSLSETLAEFERTFNEKFQYPYVFLNDEPFSEQFKENVTFLLTKKTWKSVTFAEIPHEHWSYPAWINQEKASWARSYMRSHDVMYGGSESYRHMCRYFSGFMHRHPLLLQYDYYWRIEPGANFYCLVEEDPFLFMMKNRIQYGFIQLMSEMLDTCPTLWRATKRYLNGAYQRMKTGQKGLPNMLNWFSNEKQNWTRCHFWDNFEIANFNFFRSPLYESYFNYLDKAGGFFYERWGDAPVHSLAVAMFLQPSQIHHFENMGYKHFLFSWCPTKKELTSKCACDPAYYLNTAIFEETPCTFDILTKMKNYRTAGKENSSSTIRIS